MNTVPCQLQPGTILQGRSVSYCVEAVLGQGSFGITYLASVLVRGELGALSTGAKVAIKEFFMREVNDRHPGSTIVTASGDRILYNGYKEKFLKEARSMARLNHPGIVKMCDLFETNNTAYYVMELLDESLDHLVESMPGRVLPEWTAIDICATVSRTLSYLHSVNMVHLDLKPGNIMLRGDNPVLIDFGLSKQYDSTGNAETTTSVGGGTPGYAPMEQMGYTSGDVLPVTMDIYALGATLFKLLTGHTPPPASIIFNDGFPEHELVIRGVSPSTIGIIKRAMQPRQCDRYATVDLMLKDIESSLPIEVDVECEEDNSKCDESFDPRRTMRKAHRGPAQTYDSDTISGGLYNGNNVYSGRATTPLFNKVDASGNFEDIDIIAQDDSKPQEVVPRWVGITLLISLILWFIYLLVF